MKMFKMIVRKRKKVTLEDERTKDARKKLNEVVKDEEEE